MARRGREEKDVDEQGQVEEEGRGIQERREPAWGRYRRSRREEVREEGEREGRRGMTSEGGGRSRRGGKKERKVSQLGSLRVRTRVKHISRICSGL